MNPAAARRRFEAYLRRRGLRVTQQRLLILELAWSTHRHYSAEELYAWAKTRDASVSRATVYRTLALLVDGHFVSELDSGRGQMLYEHILGHHHHDHMICLGCGKIIEFRCEAIEELQRQEAAKRHFHVASHTLNLVGYCASCAREQAAAGEPQSAGGVKA
ncbi:MAG: transcriptional repressor [Planctomycetota bacterium]|nr:MAG: transcriptional repressor [Planctomycetota bacterium]